MTVQTLKMGKQRYVVLREADFRKLQKQAAQLTEQERGDIAESIRRLAEPGESIPLEQVCKELGL